MGASITLAGESLIAQKQGAGEKLDIARFVLALVPGLDPNAPVDRTAGKPPAAQIVFSKKYDRKGYVSPNQVIYSLMIGSDVGDWDFNWIGLEAAEGVLLAVATVPVQQKRMNIPPLQIGNNVTRNFLVEFNGAQALTGITVDAGTWQHDFTVRLNGIDLRERMSNRDVFGRVCFLADSLQMERSFGLYQVKAGIAYVEGIRIELAEPVRTQLPALPAKAWLDVALAREGSDSVATWKVVFGETKSDYVDSNGTAHYVVELARVDVSGEITDLRVSEPITGALVKQYALRDGDYANLRARATTKDDVDLGNLPNAKSDDPGTDSSDILATTKALNKLDQQINNSLAGMVAAFAMTSAPAGWIACNGTHLGRENYPRLFARIGTTFGAGDGVTTFVVPDLRGKFVRSWDDSGAIDPGRLLGSHQNGQNASHVHVAHADAQGEHNHPVTVRANGEHTHAASSDEQGEHSHGMWPLSLNISTAIGAGHFSVGNTRSDNTGSAGTHAHNISVAAAGNHVHEAITGVQAAHVHNITVAASGGNESRPANIALLYCIKY